jgi:hypothetical protein
MARYDILRNRCGTARLDWTGTTITLGLIDGYTFDAEHLSLAEVQSAGGVLLASARLTGKSVTADGYALSTSVVLRVVPPGGPYDLLLLADPTGIGPEAVPIVHYEGVVTLSAPGDILVKPDDLVDGFGHWLRF